MRALLFSQAGSDMLLGEIPEPELAADEVLVSLKACGICGTDVHIAREGSIPTAFTPIALGHEPAGVIAKVGGAGCAWKPGDRVAIYPHAFCGQCPECQRGREGLCLQSQIFGLHRHGAMAEMIKVPARCLVALPDTLSFEAGAILTDAVSTPYHAVVRRALLQKGETVAVFGCGGLGSQAIQFCQLFGASQIIAVDRNEAALARAKTLGATETLLPEKTPIHKKIRDLSHGGVDIAFEFVGLAQTIDEAVRSLRRGGRAVVVGIGLEKIQLPAIRTFVGNEYELKGSMGLDLKDLQEVMTLAAAGKLKLNSLISPISLEAVNEVLKDLAAGKAAEGRYVVRHDS